MQMIQFCITEQILYSYIKSLQLCFTDLEVDFNNHNSAINADESHHQKLGKITFIKARCWTTEGNNGMKKGICTLAIAPN